MHHLIPFRRLRFNRHNVISCHVMSHFTSCHVTSCRVISCHVFILSAFYNHLWIALTTYFYYYFYQPPTLGGKIESIEAEE